MNKKHIQFNLFRKFDPLYKKFMEHFPLIKDESDKDNFIMAVFESGVNNWIKGLPPKKSGTFLLKVKFHDWNFEKVTIGFYATKFEYPVDNGDIDKGLDYKETSDEFYLKEGFYEREPLQASECPSYHINDDEIVAWQPLGL